MISQDTNFENVLDNCLADLRSGQATVDECLKKHAGHAAQLEPLLRVAARLQQTPTPALPDAARLRIETQLQDHIRQLPPRRAVAKPKTARVPFYNLLRWASTVTLTVLLLTVMTGGIIRASGSLPGEPLYSIKTINEQIEAWLTPPEKLAEMHLKFADRRLNEVTALGHLGIVDDLAIIQMESEVRQAMELLPTLPNDKRIRVTQDILEFTERQHYMLATLTHYTSPLSQVGLEWGIDTAARRTIMLKEMLQNKNPSDKRAL